MKRGSAAIFCGAAILLAGAVFSGSPLATADVSTGLTTPSSPSQLPPEINLAVANTAANFTSCQAPQIASTLMTGVDQARQVGNMNSSQLMNNQMMMMTGQGNVVSCGNDQLMGAPPSCQQLITGNTFNASALDQYRQQAQAALSAAQCKENLFTALRSELQCMSQQASLIMQSIQSSQSAYQQYIQIYEQFVSQLKAIIADRTTQQKQVQAWLEGDPNLKSLKGLSQARQDLQAIVNADVPASIASFNDQITSIVETRKNYDQQVEQRTMALTYNCFAVDQGPVAYNCPQLPPGKTCTLEEYVIERYYENQFVGPTGQVNQGALVQNQAQSSQVALQNLLSKIFNLAPTNTTLAPSDPNQANQIATAQANQLMTIFTPQDIEQQFGPELQAFNGHNLNVSGFVLGSIQNCYNTSYTETLQEKSRPGTVIYNAFLKLTTQETQTKEAMDQKIQAWAQAYSDSWKAMTRGTFNLIPDKCVGSSIALADKMVCLQTLQKNLTGLLSGTSPNSQVNETIPASVPGDAIPVSCAGLTGCETALQNVEQNLTTLIQQKTTEKDQYIVAANQQVDNLTKALSNMLSIQSQALNNKLLQINASLSTAGVRPIDIQPVQGEQLATDGDGLYKPPQNVLNYVGSQLRPPMLDLTSQGFNQSLADISNQKSQEDSRLAQAQSFIAQLNQDQTACRNLVAQNLQGQIGQSANQLAGCTQNPYWCQQVGNFNGLGGYLSNAFHLDGSSIDQLNSYSNAAINTGISCTTASTESQTNPGAPAPDADPQVAQLNRSLALYQQQQAGCDSMTDENQKISCRQNAQTNIAQTQEKIASQQQKDSQLMQQAANCNMWGSQVASGVKQLNSAQGGSTSGGVQ